MKKSDVLKLTALGAAGGAMSGFLGSGGGIFVLFGFYALKIPPEKAHASALLAVAPMCAVSLLLYKTGDNTLLAPLMLSAGAGGAAGALLLPKIKKTVLELIFAGIMIFSGIKMFF